MILLHYNFLCNTSWYYSFEMGILGTAMFEVATNGTACDVYEESQMAYFLSKSVKM